MRVKRPRLLAALAAILMITLAGGGLAAAGQEIPWLAYQEGLQAQKAGGKPVLIFFHLPYCFRCKKMEKRVYSDAQVIARLKQDFVPVMVDIDEQPDLAKQYKADYIPTHVVLVDGKEVSRFKGVLGKERFLVFLDYVTKKAYLKGAFEDYPEGS